jgi:catechol 2,3-dioxygenase-like lactoylglutathione lyase family enzyme
MLADAMVVSTVAVTDLDRAKRFFQDQLGLPLLDETPFAFRFGAGNGTQMSVRRGQPNIGQTVAHFEVDDVEAAIRELTSRRSHLRGVRDSQDDQLHRPDRSGSWCLVQGSGRQRVRPARGTDRRREVVSPASSESLRASYQVLTVSGRPVAVT